MAEIKASKKLIDTLEKFLQDELACGTVYRYSELSADDPSIGFECSGCDNPYGEDWCEAFLVRLDDLEPGLNEEDINDIIITRFVEECESKYTHFDVNGDVALWADSAGTNGVPGFKELVENAEFKEKRLDEVYCAANKQRMSWLRQFAGYEN